MPPKTETQPFPLGRSDETLGPSDGESDDASPYLSHEQLGTLSHQELFDRVFDLKQPLVEGDLELVEIPGRHHDVLVRHRVSGTEKSGFTYSGRALLRDYFGRWSDSHATGMHEVIDFDETASGDGLRKRIFRESLDKQTGQIEFYDPPGRLDESDHPSAELSARESKLLKRYLTGLNLALQRLFYS